MLTRRRARQEQEKAGEGTAKRARTSALPPAHDGPAQAEQQEQTASEAEEDLGQASSEEEASSSAADSEAESGPVRTPSLSPEPPAGGGAGLVQILGVSALQQSLRRSSREARRAAKDLAALGTAIGFPVRPETNHVMQTLWGSVHAPAPSWMADLPATLSGLDLDSSRVGLAALKALCFACSLPSTGTKAALRDRLRGRLPALPQHVPLRTALALKPLLAKPPRVRACLARLEAAGEGNVDRKITASRAKSEWCLNDHDLAALDCTLARNPHYRSAAPMRLYSLQDVKEAAIDRHGSLDALADELEKRALRSEAIRTNRTDKRAERQRQLQEALAARGLPPHTTSAWAEGYVSKGLGKVEDVVESLHRRSQREHELRQALAARGLELRSDSRLCEDYINGQGQSLRMIVDTMDEMRWFHNHTSYAAEYDKIMDHERRMDREAGDVFVWRPEDGFEVSDRAKDKAISKWVAGRKRQPGATLEQALAAPELPASLRQCVECLWNDPWKGKAAPKRRAAHKQKRKAKGGLVIGGGGGGHGGGGPGPGLSRNARRKARRRAKREAERAAARGQGGAHGGGPGLAAGAGAAAAVQQPQAGPEGGAGGAPALPAAVDEGGPAPME